MSDRTSTPDVIRIAVVDDHPAFRSGLRFMLGQIGGSDVVGEASDGDAALALAAATTPDVMLVDLAMPGMNGIELTGRLTEAHPTIAVLVLTMFEDDESVFAAMRAGAHGYLLKDAGIDELERAIRAVASGEAIFSPAVATRISRFFATGMTTRATEPAGEPFPQLTPREREILDLVAAGLSNNAIAQRLYLSHKTIRNNVSMILAKIHVDGRSQAIVEARNAGLGNPQR